MRLRDDSLELQFRALEYRTGLPRCILHYAAVDQTYDCSLPSASAFAPTTDCWEDPRGAIIIVATPALVISAVMRCSNFSLPMARAGGVAFGTGVAPAASIKGKGFDMCAVVVIVVVGNQKLKSSGIGTKKKKTNARTSLVTTSGRRCDL